MTPDELHDLADMWEETAKLFGMHGTMTMKEESHIYRQCANDLRKLLRGDKSVIAKWESPAPTNKEEAR